MPADRQGGTGGGQGDPRRGPGRRERAARRSSTGTAELVTEVMTRNQLTPADVISVVFTATADLNAEFPALAARKLGFQDVPLLCCAEIDVPGAMPRVVRLMMHVETRGAALGHAARVPARCRRAAPGHRPVTGAAPAQRGRGRHRADRHLHRARSAGPGDRGLAGRPGPCGGAAGSTSAAGAARPRRGPDERRARSAGSPPGGLLGWPAARRARPSWLSWPCRPGRPGRPCAAAQARGLARWYTDVASVKELPLAQRPRARLRPGQPSCRASAVRPGAVRPGRGPGRPVPRPALGDLPGCRRPRPEAVAAVTAWPRPAAPSRSGCRPPTTTAGRPWSRTHRTWSPRPWSRRAASPRRTAPWPWPGRACVT